MKIAVQVLKEDQGIDCLGEFFNQPMNSDTKRDQTMNQPVLFSLCSGSLSPKLGVAKRAVLAIWLVFVSVLLSQSKASAQNYPPAVNIMGLSGPDTIPGTGSGSGGLIPGPGPSSPILLSGGAGNYSGSYYSQYSYTIDTGHMDYSQGDWVTTYDGYWDNSAGSWDYSAGYWDTSAGHWDYSNCTWDANAGYWDQTTGYYVGGYDADNNWVSDFSWMQFPTWVSTPQWNGTPTWVIDPSWVSVPAWMSSPAWVSTQTSTWVVRPVWMTDGPMTYGVSQLIAVTLSINSDGSATVSIHNNDTGNSNSWTGTYDFAIGTFSGGLPSMWGINNDGTLWTPPPPPPPYASFGPPAIWVDGTLYSWSYSSFDNDAETSGTDFYLDGSGQSVWVMGNPESGYSAGGTAPSGASWSANYYSGVFETGGADVRAADAAGNWALRTPPSELPFALRVDGTLSLWRYIGFGSLQYYAGPNAGDRIAINAVGDIYVLGSTITGLYLDGVVWMPKEGRDVRAVSPDGSLRQPDSQPVTGPPDVWVNNTVWRFAGTWSQQSPFASGPPPSIGDHYLGDNLGQQLVIDPSGAVTINNLTQTFVGIYLNAEEGFDVAGITVVPGDVNGAYHTMQPTTGPPAIVANGTSFQFLGSNPDASGTAGLMVDSYGDGTDARIQITASSVSYFGADGSLLWSGAYIASSADPVAGGIFVATIGNSLAFDIRASTGAAYLQAGGSPQASHPPVVKLDGIFLRYGGSTGGSNPKDFYTGAAAGQWLSIDSTGNVAFPQGTSSVSLSSTTMLVGNVFLTGSGHDLRTCTSDNLPLPPTDTPHWGPPTLWVQNASWNYIGTVSDEALTIHADYYAGTNQGQVLWLGSDGTIVQPPDLTTVLGTYNHGVFQDVASGMTLAAGGVTVPNPVSGHPDVLTVSGQVWQRSTLSNGTLDIYLGPQGGQQLSIDDSGAVSYLNTPIGVLQTISGTFSGGELDFPTLPLPDLTITKILYPSRP